MHTQDWDNPKSKRKPKFLLKFFVIRKTREIYIVSYLIHYLFNFMKIFIYYFE